MTSPRVASLAEALTLDELVSLVAGKDTWTTAAIPRLGIPSIKVTDGPNGARGGGALVGGVTAAAFPVGIAIGASWNPQLAREIGAALAQEAKSKGARVLLGPTTNMHRTPVNGRNFECYSEDPHLASSLTAAYVAGLQENGVAATVKHFIANDSEYQRNSMSSDVDERTLREIYYPPFEAAIRQAGAWAIMSSYNRLNGAYVSDSADQLTGVLRDDWGFDGVLMSDWFGTYSTVEAAKAGLDLEMPGPTRHRGEKLKAAVEAGLVSPETLRESARRILTLIERVGAFERPEIEAERADDRPETRALIRRAGAEAMTLLKNEGALPLKPRAGVRIAVIGPNAKFAEIMGGGSAQINPHYRISPFEGLRAALPADVELVHETGAENRRLTRLFEGEVEVEYFHGRDLAGAPCHRAKLADSQFMFLGRETPGFEVGDFSARMRMTFRPEAAGEHRFGLVASAGVRLRVDNETVIDAPVFKPGQEYFNCACDEIVAMRNLEAGRAYEMVVEYRANDAAPPLGVTTCRFGVQRVLGAGEIARAAELAATADATILCIGLNGEWDGEGLDRPHIGLPPAVDALVAAVAAASKCVIVALQSGGPVAMPWLDSVAAVVQAWYPGQELGAALADVLLGHADPGGRLPQSFPRAYEDNPAFINYPGDLGHVRYGEGVFIGYRYYEKKKVAPLFPFGFGLSYARFAYSPLRLSAATLAPGETLTVEIDVTNIADREGSTVVQVYVADPVAAVARPEKELKGFAKLALGPGETRTARIALDMRAFAWFDVTRRAFVAEAGRFDILAGVSSAEIVARAEVELAADWIEPLRQGDAK